MKFDTPSFFITVIIIAVIGSLVLITLEKYRIKKRHKKWTIIYNGFLAGEIDAIQYARICAIVLNNALNRQ